ncbi:MAG TPA: hypothetical protein VGN47_04860 [Blastococcus sp.]|nr:hypothetical protein [Blastococcus sp.]
MSPVRRLVVRPAFLVADEPTARLDADLSAHVLATCATCTPRPAPGC